MTPIRLENNINNSRQTLVGFGEGVVLKKVLKLFAKLSGQRG
jgi:hypothetical protein